MATTKRTRFSRRLPDHVTDELVNVLGSDPKLFGFNDLFEDVYERLKERNAVSGGEEMLRLRAYEKLQNLVTRGLAEKTARNIADSSAFRKRTATILLSKRVNSRSKENFAKIDAGFASSESFN